MALSLKTLLARVSALAPDLNVSIVCGGELLVKQFASLLDAEGGDIAFLASPKYASQLSKTKASAVVLNEVDWAAQQNSVMLPGVVVCNNPYAFFAFASQVLQNDRELTISNALSTQNIHPTAIIDASAVVGHNVNIGAYSVIESGVIIGNDTLIGAHCVVGKGAQIGQNTQLYSHVTIYHSVQLGVNCIVHSGTVIGADGFGFAPYKKRWVKIPQTGTVVIGDDVELGSNCSIDRGALGNTTIGRGTKLDNLIQIAHNVQVGEDCAFAANIAIAGSAVIGNRVQMGGKAGVLGHLSVCDDVVISSCTLVTKTIAKPGFYTGVYPLQDNAEWEKNAVSLKRLNTLREQVKAIDRQVQQFQTSHLAPSNAA